MELLTGKIRPLYFKYLAAASGSTLSALAMVGIGIFREPLHKRIIKGAHV